MNVNTSEFISTSLKSLGKIQPLELSELELIASIAQSACNKIHDHILSHEWKKKWINLMCFIDEFVGFLIKI